MVMRATVSLEVMRAAITTAMADANGHVPIAAKALGVSRRTLARWLVQLPDVPRAPRGFHIGAKPIEYEHCVDWRNTENGQWEEVFAADTRREALDVCRDYRANMPAFYVYRVVRRRCEKEGTDK